MQLRTIRFREVAAVLITASYRRLHAGLTSLEESVRFDTLDVNGRAFPSVLSENLKPLWVPDCSEI
jgi:hypothetical protein